jgi:NAD-dependent deacetylase
MSAESGVPTFRGPNGLWTKHGEPSNFGYQRFMTDPRGWWEERLHGTQMPEMRAALASAKPNPGHRALVDLEEMGVLRYLITQNVDNLHRAAGSRNVAEIHGNSTLLRCIHCNSRYVQQAISLDSLPPLCPHCGGIIKIDTVMFGEPIPPDVLQVSQREASRSDCMLILGTSGVVYPAAGLPDFARRANRAFLIEVNPEETALSDVCDIVVRAPTGEALPVLVELVRTRRQAARN